MKKRDKQAAGRQNAGQFNYIGLTDEILQLKNIIDHQIEHIPESATPKKTFRSQISEITSLNAKMVDTVNKLQIEEQKAQSTIDSIPVLKAFDSAKVTNRIVIHPSYHPPSAEGRTSPIMRILRGRNIFCHNLRPLRSQFLREMSLQSVTENYQEINDSRLTHCMLEMRSLHDGLSK